MDVTQISAELRVWVAQQLLEGDERGLDERTPLLRLGVINSVSLLELLAFVEERFGVALALESITPEMVKDIATLAQAIAAARPG